MYNRMKKIQMTLDSTLIMSCPVHLLFIWPVHMYGMGTMSFFGRSICNRTIFPCIGRSIWNDTRMAWFAWSICNGTITTPARPYQWQAIWIGLSPWQGYKALSGRSIWDCWMYWFGRCTWDDISIGMVQHTHRLVHLEPYDCSSGQSICIEIFLFH